MDLMADLIQFMWIFNRKKRFFSFTFETEKWMIDIVVQKFNLNFIL